MSEKEAVRIDKWLWCVRLFKTRSQATEACRAGKIRLSGNAVKPSHETSQGETYTVSTGPLTRTVKVLALLHNRVSARLVPEFMEDFTPPEELERLRMQRELNYERWDRGTGRPTKKVRRLIEKLKGKE